MVFTVRSSNRVMDPSLMDCSTPSRSNGNNKDGLLLLDVDDSSHSWNSSNYNRDCKENDGNDNDNMKTMILGLPTKTMEAGENERRLVECVHTSIEYKMNCLRRIKLLPIEVITRLIFVDNSRKTTTTILSSNSSHNNTSSGSSIDDDHIGKMYYIKIRTNHRKYSWLFVKLFEPAATKKTKATTMADAMKNPVQFQSMKKMKQEYDLVTF